LSNSPPEIRSTARATAFSHSGALSAPSRQVTADGTPIVSALQSVSGGFLALGVDGRDPGLPRTPTDEHLGHDHLRGVVGVEGEGCESDGPVPGTETESSTFARSQNSLHQRCAREKRSTPRTWSLAAMPQPTNPSPRRIQLKPPIRGSVASKSSTSGIGRVVAIRLGAVVSCGVRYTRSG